MRARGKLAAGAGAALLYHMASFSATGQTTQPTTRPFMQPVAPARSTEPAWFNLQPPGATTDPAHGPLDMTAMSLPARPARFGPGPLDPGLSGDAIKADLKAIVSFSHQSRAAGDYLWGRITGRPAYDRTVAWAVERFRAAGLADARLEYFHARDLHLPVSGEVRLLGTDALGTGSRDIILRSAMIGGEGPVNGHVSAPLVYVGQGLDADLAGRNLVGRIAVLVSTPNPSLYSALPAKRIGAALSAGAVGVIEIQAQAGNLQSFDRDRHGCGTGLCFTVGGEDGYFLQNVLGAATKAGETVSASLSARSETLNPRIANAVATLPGKSERSMIIVAHADGWFGGADDNGSGLAVMTALARHFARLPQLERTLVFVATAGHHSTSVNGARAFRTRHADDYLANADLIINLEHPAQSDLMRSYLYRESTNFGSPFVMTTGDLPKQVAVSDRSLLLEDLWRQAIDCFGLDLQRTIDRELPGDLNAFADLKGVPRTQMIASGGLYHTSGDDLWSVPEAALERAARFHAHLIATVAQAPPGLPRVGRARPTAQCPPTP